MNYQSISIRESKVGRDQFLAKMIQMEESEMLDLAIDLFDNRNEFKTQYDRANAITVAAVAWWYAGKNEIAQNMITQALNTLGRKDRVRDRLTFLISDCLTLGVKPESVKDSFVRGGMVNA